MANVATLTLDSTGRHLVRGAKYRVPLLWLPCFRREDVTVAADEQGEDTVSVAATTSGALKLLESRREALEAIATNLNDFLPAWVAFLRGLGDGRLVLDPSEVLMMHESAELAAPLHGALSFFDAPTEAGAIALIELASLGQHLDRTSRRVTTPPQQRMVDVVPEAAALFGPDALLPPDPVENALMGYEIPGR